YASTPVSADQRIICRVTRPRLTQPDVLEVQWLAVDALGGRRDPSGHLARLVHCSHQLGVARAIFLGRQPCAAARRELLGRQPVALWIVAGRGECADLAVESGMRKRQALAKAARGKLAVPSRQPALAVLDVGVTQDRVHRPAQRDTLHFSAWHPQFVVALERAMVPVHSGSVLSKASLK